MQDFDHNSPLSMLQDYLRSKGWLDPGETLQNVGKAGDGNMNVVLRIQTNARSFILKQSRPYVQKYPQIPAPLSRIAVEREFYSATQNGPLQAYTPDVLGYDAQNHTLLLEDLGHCEDMTSMYGERALSSKKLEKLVMMLSLLHGTAVPPGFPENLEMRRLNHQHIFVLPFLEDNGFQLDGVQQGLEALSKRYRKDSELREVIDQIGHRYLSQGNTLLHGDYYPGSWMTEKTQLYVIDPEFSFSGFAEFDLGVMTAHLILTTHDVGYLDRVLVQYQGKADKKLTAQVAGIEIMRRLIGLAQLPLERTLEEKETLLKMAHKMILS